MSLHRSIALGLLMIALLGLTIFIASEDGQGITLNVKYQDPTTVDLEWTEYSNAGDFLRYELDQEATTIHTETNVTETFFRVENLKRDSLYNFTIRVYNSTDDVVESHAISVTTNEMKGTITINTTWTAGQSPCNFTNDVTIMEDATLTIQQNVTVNCRNHELKIRGELNDLVGVTFTGNGISLTDVSSVSISNCTFEGIDGFAIELEGCDGSSIQGNVVSGPGNGIMLVNSNNATLTNNTSPVTLDSSNDCKIMKTTGRLHLTSSHRNIIETTHIGHESTFGIQLISSNSNSINNATISDHDASGINLQDSENNTITNTTFQGIQGNAIRLTSSIHTVISGCVINSTIADAVTIDTSSNKNRFTDIQLTNSSFNGFAIYGEENIFKGIQIRKVTASGMVVRGRNTTLTNVSVQDSGNRDIFIIDATNCTLQTVVGNVSMWEVKDSMAENVTGNIDLDDAHRNIIKNNRGAISLTESSNNTVKGNSAENVTYGIALYQSSYHNNIVNNSMENCGSWIEGGGIRFRWDCRWNTVTNNTMTNCTFGLYLTDQCMNNTFDQNTIKTSSREGIYVYNNHGSNFSMNEVLGSGSSGFILSSSHRNSLTDNEVRNNSAQGFNIYESNSNIMIRNFAAYNEQGFHITRGNHNQLLMNMAENNSRYGVNVWESDNNTLRENHLVNSTREDSGIGVRLWDSHFNSIEENMILSNNKGIELWTSSNNNNFSSNTIKKNEWGIYIWKSFTSHNNSIYNNYFNNSKNAYDPDGNNFWNVTNRTDTNILGGPQIGGNYWHDWYGTDSDGDGLGDTLVPYTSNGRITNGGDHLPLPQREPVWNINTNKGFFTIQAAINDPGTLNGHTIQVSPGTYKENLKITKEIILVSAGNYMDTTIEAANANDHTIEFQRDVIIMTGFTVTGAAAEGKAGVFISDDSARSDTGRGAKICIVSTCYLTGNFHGILIDNSTYNTVNQSVISGNTGAGVVIQGPSAKENTVKNNNIGLKPEKDAALANLHGVLIRWGANLNVIGGEIDDHRNIISGNTGTGITIEGNGTIENYIRGNYIGVSNDGKSAVPNKIGVHLRKQASENKIGGNTIYDRINVISGNTEAGVLIEHKFTTNNTVGGNIIGTNPNGTKAIANKDGIVIRDNATGNFVGTSWADFYNIISGNTETGVVIQGQGTDENRIWGNIIGTNRDGATGLGNQNGIKVQGGAQNPHIGRWNHEGRRNTISGNSMSGIHISGEGTKRTLVEGNLIGISYDGAKAVPNMIGVSITYQASHTTIGGPGIYGRNIISGNLADGILIYESSSNIVVNNYIGTTKDGTSALANEGNGVRIDGGARNNMIGSWEGFGNLISGNERSGILIDTDKPVEPSSSENHVLGNHIGTNRDGDSAIPNGRSGVEILRSSSNYVGGIEEEDKVKQNGNVISGNTQGGVSIWGVSESLSQAKDNFVIGNTIGLSLDGTKAVPNQDGVVVALTAEKNMIGTYHGGGNVISGNRDTGVLIKDVFTEHNHVVGNLIGTSPDGEKAIPNEGNGIQIKAKASFNYIGGKDEKGTITSNGNIISGNGKAGILVTDFYTRKNWIIDNKIGTNIDGTKTIPNGEYGIQCREACLDIWIGTISGGGNLISGNEKGGIFVDGTGLEKETLRILIMDNLIGTKKDGKTALPNNGPGIELSDYAKYVQIGGFFDGKRARPNTISGNKGSGVVTTGKSITHAIMGNYIGLTSDGKALLPNQRYGLEFLQRSGGHWVGAMPRTKWVGAGSLKIWEYEEVSNIGYHNTIGGNLLGGILMDGSSTNHIMNNYIGTDIGAKGVWSSAAKLGNGGYGILTRNVKGRNHIIGNYIWYNAKGGISILNAGSGKLKDNSVKYNGGNTGIHLDNGSPEITGNIIFGDASDGIYCSNGSNPILRYNVIYNNSGFAVNNVDESVTIDAGYNYWGPQGDWDGFNGNIDRSFELSDGPSSGNSITVNGTNTTGFLNGTIVIDFSVLANTTFTILEFDESPVNGGSIENYIGPHYLLLVDDPDSVLELTITVYYSSSLPIFVNESDLRLGWWENGQWGLCTDCTLNTTNIGDNIGGRISITITPGSTPGTLFLGEFHFALNATVSGTPEVPIIPPDNDNEDGNVLIWFMLGIVIVAIFLVLFLKRDILNRGPEENDGSTEEDEQNDPMTEDQAEAGIENDHADDDGMTAHPDGTTESPEEMNKKEISEKLVKSPGGTTTGTDGGGEDQQEEEKPDENSGGNGTESGTGGKT